MVRARRQAWLDHGDDVDIAMRQSRKQGTPMAVPAIWQRMVGEWIVPLAVRKGMSLVYLLVPGVSTPPPRPLVPDLGSIASSA